MKGARNDVGAWVAWCAALGALTGALWVVRAQLDEAHVALTYLLLVLAAGVRGTAVRGIVLALLSFLCFNFFFVPPYNTLSVADQRDWLVLFAYLVVAMVAAQLIHRVRVEADEARRRADEVNRLSALGAETLNAGRAEDALHAIADVIRGTLALDACDIHLPDDADGLARQPGAALAAERGTGVVERVDGSLRLLPSAAAELPHLPEMEALSLPLRVRERTVGVLRIARRGGLALDAGERRFFSALAYYAALGAERVRLEGQARHAEALREADRLKDALIASVSHDLRTPLTTIKALAREMRDDGDDRAVVIEEEADRLNRCVADLLDLSRLNAGELRVSAEVVAAEDLVGAALQRVSGSLAGREVRARVEPGEPVLVGRFDFVHSLRVLANLLENAHKYAPPGTPVDLDARRDGDRLRFEVADRGAGIAPSEAEHVFAPFYRSPGAPPDAGGAGLGLSIARRLAEAQGGTVEYEPRPGGGSVFTLTLPAVDTPSLPSG
jgi:two-component system sensor histidine kinase KdpD